MYTFLERKFYENYNAGIHFLPKNGGKNTFLPFSFQNRLEKKNQNFFWNVLLTENVHLDDALSHLSMFFADFFSFMPNKFKKDLSKFCWKSAYAP